MEDKNVPEEIVSLSPIKEDVAGSTEKAVNIKAIAIKKKNKSFSQVETFCIKPDHLIIYETEGKGHSKTIRTGDIYRKKKKKKPLQAGRHFKERFFFGSKFGSSQMMNTYFL